MDVGAARRGDERLTGCATTPPRLWGCCVTGWAGRCSAQAPRRRARPGRYRPVGQDRLAADHANAQRRKACLVFFDESALSLTPNVRPSWAPRGRPPVLVHPFNWKKASMAALICDGVCGGGAKLSFHVAPGSYGWWSSGCLPTRRNSIRWGACSPASRPWSWPTSPRRPWPR